MNLSWEESKPAISIDRYQKELSSYSYYSILVANTLYQEILAINLKINWTWIVFNKDTHVLLLGQIHISMSTGKKQLKWNIGNSQNLISRTRGSSGHLEKIPTENNEHFTKKSKKGKKFAIQQVVRYTWTLGCDWDWKVDLFRP